jgi:hypothetical protein
VPFGATPVAERVVRDGNVITGGGVTAGIDFALAVVAELRDPETAQAIQLQIEYAPAPPFTAGSPETAPPAVLVRVRERNAMMATRRRAPPRRLASKAAPLDPPRPPQIPARRPRRLRRKGEGDRSGKAVNFLDRGRLARS